MGHSRKRRPGEPSDVLIDIVETLETCGLDRDEYQLYDFIDVEALQQLVDSGRGDVEVRFTVEGIQLAVTADGIDVLSEREFRTADS